MTSVNLTRLSNAELLTNLRELVAARGRTDARFVAHLAETEERRLHLEAGFSSLFDYCLRGLGLSENEAFHRITAARLARRFPRLLELLDSRALTLSAACLLRNHLTNDNHFELLAASTHKSKREVELLLATLFPAAQASASIRKLPRPIAARMAKAVEARVATVVAETATVTQPATPSTSKDQPAPHFRVQFDATVELKTKLKTAGALLSHKNPKGDLAVTVERALDLLIERLEKERWAKSSRPRRPVGPVSRTKPRETEESVRPEKGAEADAKPRAQAHAAPIAPEARRRKRIASEVRRIVATRDAGCCSFTSDNAQRCGARAFLQFHHEHPWARGGSDNVENLRLLCAAHNRLLAERDFGRERVERLARRT